MNKMRALFVVVALGAMLFAIPFYSCNSVQQDQAADTTAKLDSVPKTEVPKLAYPLTTPLEITKMLNEAGAGFILNITNPVKNADKYVTEKSKALNLGVYGADLSYSSTYRKVQETSGILQTSKKLTEELGILNAFTEKEIQRIDKNIENSDSLYKIITTSFENTYKSLNDAGKGQISALVLAGGWIEGMYIATQLTATSKKNEKMVKVIVDNKSTLEQLIITLDLYKESADVQEITTELTAVKAIFDAVQGTMTPKQVDELTAKVEALRAKITK